MTAGFGNGAFAPGRFRLLLMSMIALIVGTAVTAGSSRATFIEFILLAITIAVGIAELRGPGQRRLIPVGVATGMIIVAVVDYAVLTLRHLPLIAGAVVTLFAGVVIWLTYGSVMRSNRPVADRIVGSICVYILMGLGWASVYATLDAVAPGSFRYPVDSSWLAPGTLRYRYFSFVTLATLGYGDITPVTPLAGVLASLEAITGQLYIGITVARLVALSLTDRAGTGRGP